MGVLRRCVAINVIIGALMLSACGSPSRTVTVSEEDANSTVTLSVGDTLEAVLEGNPTTGYQWECTAGDEAILKQVGEPEFQPDSDAIGSGGKVTLRFEAAAPGQTALRLDYFRSFEAEEPPLQTFEVTVQVSE